MTADLDRQHFSGFARSEATAVLAMPEIPGRTVL
jgi:hypothetical protein